MKRQHSRASQFVTKRPADTSVLIESHHRHLLSCSMEFMTGRKLFLLENTQIQDLVLVKFLQQADEDGIYRILSLIFFVAN